MSTSFLTGLSTEVKPFISGIQQDENITRYILTNSRNYNRKIIRLAQTVTSQKLGIIAPTVAPTGTPGGGASLYYRYVYVNKLFIDPLALEATDPYIRSNASPVLTILSTGGAATAITPTISTDAQVTHIWLYVAAAAAGPFFRLSVNYEITNTAGPTWAGVTVVPTAGYSLELDNSVPDTCRISEECNGFFSYAGFVAITSATGSINIGASVVAITSGSWPDGIIGLNFQFSTDTTGGIGGNGVHLAVYTSATQITLVNLDGTPRNYDGPTNKINAVLKLWRNSNIIQISKRFNPDAIPGVVDPDFLLRGSGSVTAISKPQTGFAMRYHYNNNGKKSVEIADFTQGIPPRRTLTSSIYSASNPRACCSAGGRMFYYDFNSGVIEDKGMIHVPISMGIIPNLMRSLAGTSADISEMEFDESRNLLFLSVAPTGYSKAYYLIVYNLITNTWNLWFMLPDISAMRRVTDTTTGNVVIRMGSSNGSYTTWPSVNFNEAVGTSTYGVLAANDDSTHLTVVGTPLQTSGDALADRWVMVWDDNAALPTYQFARISSNTNNRMTLDTFIGPNSTTQFSPIPTIGNAYWVGPIQSIIGPNWDYNAIPDDDGQIYDMSMTTSGLDAASSSRLSLFRNFETTPSFGGSMIHNTYSDSTLDPDHQSLKLANKGNSVETTGVTGWQITDNNEAAFSLKALVKRVQQINPQKESRK